nr:hypothetical protein [Tanacetum cinerariifolium]
MQTRSSSKLARDQTSNPTSSTNPTPKGRIRRSSKQKVENSHFEENLTFVDTMTDNRTMAEMLRAPTEGCVEAIVVPPILAEQFKLKYSLINMMTSEQFFGLEKDNPHDHGQPWDDLVSKFINEFFHPSRTTNLRNEISNFQQKFDEYFHEAWERYKDLLRACPRHGFTELHQLDTFYNALNPADQDSLNVAAGGNLLEKCPQDALTIIENKSKVRNSRSKPIASSVNACDNHSSSELAKLTHAVNQQTSACLATSGNTFPEYRDNIQGYISAATGNFNQGHPGYRPQGSGTLPGNTIAKPKGELKAITTRSGLVTEGPIVPNPPNLEEDECVEETYTDPDHAEYNIKVPPPPPVQKPKPPIQRNFVIHTRDSLPPHIPYPSRMLKQKQQEKDDIQIQKFWNMFKQLHLNITLAEALVHNSQSKPIASPVNACDNHSSSELAKLTHAVNQKTSVVTTTMTAMLKQFQSNPPPAQVTAIEEICVTCGGAHPYYQCLAADGNTFPESRDNIQGYVSAATGNFNQ